MKRRGSSARLRVSVVSRARSSSCSACVGVGHFALGLELDALVDQQREVAAVVQQQVRPLGILEAEDLGEDIVPIGLELLALPGEDGHAGGGDGGGGVVLGRVDVAACPGHFGAEFDERLDQDGRLDGHVQAAGDVGPGQGLARGHISAAGP